MPPRNPPTAALEKTFARRVLRWFARHGRKDFPWQTDKTPYRVWVSEVMLQQTQAQNVAPYFLRFVERFPTIESLASASPAAVARHWSGLGYYARAQNLRKAAAQLCEQHGGNLPREFDELIRLPGIGRSTAGAILALCYGERVAILDGNVKRLLARHRRIRGDASRAAVSAQLWDWSQRLLPTSKRAMPNYTQAVMDLGATVCVRRNARCGECPVADDCLALRHDCVNELPESRPRKTLPVKRVYMLLATHGGKVLMQRRPSTGIWAGLLTLPEAESAAAARAWGRRVTGAPLSADTPRKKGSAYSAQSTCSARPKRPSRSTRSPTATNGASDKESAWPPMRHTFSHFHLDITPLCVKLARAPRVARQGGGRGSRQRGNLIWCKIDAGMRQAPTPVKRLLAKLKEVDDS